MTTSKHPVLQLADAYCSEIELLMQNGNLKDSLNKLSDFARDCDNTQQNHITLIYRRLSAHNSQQRGNRSLDETSNDIAFSVLELRDTIKATAYKNHPANTIQEQASKGENNTSSNNSKKGGKPEEYVSSSNDSSKGSFIILRERYYKDWQNRQAERDITLLSASKISKSYQNTYGDFRLTDVDVTLKAGEITGVVGMNASGKSTLLKILAGETSQDYGGSILYPALSGDNLDWKKIKSNIAYIPQEQKDWPGYLMRNLTFTAAAYGVLGQENTNLVEHLVYRYGLDKYRYSAWNALSGGYKTRFEIVRALLQRPRLLILDEPLAALDIVAQQALLRDLKSIAKNLAYGTSIILTSQHLYEVESIADRMVILDDGVCLFSDYLTNVPQADSNWIFEIEANVLFEELKTIFQMSELESIEPTANGAILNFIKTKSRSEIISSIIHPLGDRLVSFRDLTKSTRPFFSKKIN